LPGKKSKETTIKSGQKGQEKTLVKFSFLKEKLGSLIGIFINNF